MISAFVLHEVDRSEVCRSLTIYAGIERKLSVLGLRTIYRQTHEGEQ